MNFLVVEEKRARWRSKNQAAAFARICLSFICASAPGVAYRSSEDMQ